MNRTCLDLTSEPAGPPYRELLEHAMLDCSTALLVVRRGMSLNESARAVLAQLAGFLARDTERSEWPGTQLFGHTARVLEQRLVPGCIAVLQQAVDSLYAWRQPNLPEDLCLLRADGEPWLVSIAHERDGFLYLAPVESVRLFESLPDIRQVMEECPDPQA